MKGINNENDFTPASHLDHLNPVVVQVHSARNCYNMRTMLVSLLQTCQYDEVINCLHAIISHAYRK